MHFLKGFSQSTVDLLSGWGYLACELLFSIANWLLSFYYCISLKFQLHLN